MTTPTGSALAVSPGQEFWSPTQLAALQQIGVQQADNGNLAVFLNYAQRTGLDPFARQIYMINRAGKWTIQAGIDGLRIVAERSGHYAGQVGPEYCGPDGVWRDVWTAKEAPVASRIGVLRHGFATPLYAVAYFDEYAQKKDGKPTSMWASKPLLMLAKCAEALALRKAFPNDLSGIYTAEEMGTHEEATERPTISIPTPAPEPVVEDAVIVEETTGEIIEDETVEPLATDPQLKAIATILGKVGVKDRDERHKYVEMIVGHPVEDAHLLTKSEAGHVIDMVKNLADASDPAAAFAEFVKVLG